MPTPATTPVEPLTTESETAKAKSLIEEVKTEIAKQQASLKMEQLKADQAADASRLAKLDSIVQHRLYGNPDEKGSEREALMPMLEENAASPGGKAYENFKSAYQELVRMAIALCYVLTAYFRSSGASMASSLYWTVAPLMSKVFESSDLSVELHEDILKASHCAANGEVTFDKLPPSLFTAGTPEVMQEQLSTMNQFLVTGFLLSHGYEPDANNVFTHKDGTLLTSSKFEQLKNDPDEGLRHFSEKYLPVRITPRPMGPVGKSAPEAEEIEPASAPRPTR